MRDNRAIGGRKGGRGRIRNRRQYQFEPSLLVLDNRTLLSTFIVNNYTDTPVTGETDLRQAIASVNSTAGANTVEFASGGRDDYVVRPARPEQHERAPDDHRPVGGRHDQR